MKYLEVKRPENLVTVTTFMQWISTKIFNHPIATAMYIYDHTYMFS